MPQIEDAIERIKRLECPTGEVENRVAGILEEYQIVRKGEAVVKRDKHFDKDGIEAFTSLIHEKKGNSLVILAKSGPEDYVAKVVDAYLQ